jgi:hypothetical protein
MFRRGVARRATAARGARRRGIRYAARGPIAAVAVLGLAAGLIAPLSVPSATAAAGSLVGGVAWADADRDGMWDPDESTRAGVTVELLSSPTGPVVATTTSLNNGTFGFANVADGTYYVRMVAPGPFRFPNTASGQNVFHRAEVPATNQPERGIAGPVTVSGASQVTNLGAGLQPLVDLKIDRLQIQNSCGSYAATGTPPFDASDGPGRDSGTANCVVRTKDLVRQNYSVSVTGLPDGVSIQNVVLELTVSPVSDPDDPSDVADAKLELAGPGAGGLPAGCLDAASGATPPSSATRNADGSITVACNLGPMSSNVATVSLLYRFTGDTPVPGFASVTGRAYAGQGDAGRSGTVEGPVVEVTALPEWQLAKTLNTAPTATTQTIDGVVTPGFYIDYRFRFEDLSEGTGGAELVWPVSFTDRMTEFPNARILSCTALNDWGFTCPLNTAAGANGWSISIAPLRPAALTAGAGEMVMRVFVPRDDAYEAMDPDWDRGEPLPEGPLTWKNLAEDTDGWHMVGGQLNNDTGFEPGWDGTEATGDNVVETTQNIVTPTVNVSKGMESGTFGFGTRTINGVTMSGYAITYRFYLTVGQPVRSILTPWPEDPDRPTDQWYYNQYTTVLHDLMVDQPGAYLVGCQSYIASGTTYQRGNLTCPEINQLQGADGWDFVYTPSQTGLNQGVGSWLATFFIPEDRVTDDRCTASATEVFHVRNELHLDGDWNFNGAPINGTGFEPGWNGTTASGDNVDDRNLPVRVGDCGTISGTKGYYQMPGSDGLGTASAGDVFGSYVQINASNNLVHMTNPTLCDVFDVSVWRIYGNPYATTPQEWDPHLLTPLDTSAYVIEYAVGTNAVDTQAGPKASTGLYPIDSSANTSDVQGCRDAPGRTWTTDPAATFGPNWRDQVNMVRARPIDPTRVETGPFVHQLRVGLQLRDVYNGGPDAGTAIPAGAQLNNAGGWTSTQGGTGWGTTSARLTNTMPIAGRKVFVNPATGGIVDNGTFATGQRLLSDVDVTVSAGNTPLTDAPGPAIIEPTVCDVFDVSVLRLGTAASDRATILPQAGIDPSRFVIEYAVGPNQVDTQAGPLSGGLYPVNRSSLATSASGCREFAGPWSSDPTSFGPNWQDRVNMVRVRPIDDGYTLRGGFRLYLRTPLYVRAVYNGGPDAGQSMPSGIRLSNVGGWSAGDGGAGWATMEKEVRYAGMSLTVSKAAQRASYLPGQTAVWNLNVGIANGVVGGTMQNLRLVDTVPLGLIYDATCTQNGLPAGVTVSYNAVSREVTFQIGDVPVVSATQTVYGGATALRVCATVDTLAQPGDSFVNQVQAFADNSNNAPIATATTSATGSGQLGLTKSVDKPYVASGETFTWALEWGNTSTEIAFQPVDVIDVLPWNGDGESGANGTDAVTGVPLQRDQYPSDYAGRVRLTGALAAPTYQRGGTGAVAGTWYYATVSPGTIAQDPRDPANADPAASGGVWRTASEIADFGAVTAVRFVSADWLLTSTRVRAVIPMVATSTALDNLYVNKAEIFSGTFPNQPLLSNEPYVQMPGFSLGDLVWFDLDFDGRYSAGDEVVPFLTLEVLDANGDVVATPETDANGRWSASALPAGTYTVRIPAELFQPGGRLAQYTATAVRRSAANGENENLSNNNTGFGDLAVTGLVSAPITLAYRYSTGPAPRLIGGNGPTNDDVAHLAPPLIAPEFTNFTVDLALAPIPQVDIVKRTNTVDANDPTGPYVPVGGAVRWSYEVTNTGTADLYDVTVTDDMLDDDATQIDCDGTGGNVIGGPLAPGETFSCIADGVATLGQYANVGTVTARPHDTVDESGNPVPGVEVTDDDPSHYFGSEPSVDIEKATNGQDADEPSGPWVRTGTTVRWSYVVTNTGNVPLTDVTVTDDRVAASDILCSDPDGEPVGGTMRNVVPGPVAPGASFTCVATGLAIAGQYENLGTVVGTAPATTDVDGELVPGVQVSDDDPSHYFGADPAIDIEKATNGEDADTPTGPVVAPGGEVEWSYVVTNTGNVELHDVRVTDDRVASADIRCEDPAGTPIPGPDTNVFPGPLAPGASFACVATGTATPGQYANLGTVVATAPDTVDADGEPVVDPHVSDDDPSHYLGAVPAVDIEKATNGEDADLVTGPLVPKGGEVRWTYVVTNTGNIDLLDLVVTDDQVDADEIDCDGTGSNAVAGPLAPGDSFTCVATGTAVLGQYANLGTVVAVGAPTTDVNGDPVPGVPVTDDDPSHYFGVEPPVYRDILAFTGAELGGPLGLALKLLMLGVLAMLFVRRRARGELG